ncbi:MAG: Gfo/Idh/MocA family oxidoreductase [Candidatus Kerfeldbacteria bacterium]|nr:Gfo/Idh/MocA family oxidoreductase [Candidatus Kerfeldbacteria bacterium]
MKNFAITGVAGYIAPRHLKAIKETGNTVVAALDPHDSVGILDSYFPEARFFTEFERFDRHVDKLRRHNKEKEVHYVSICTPNYLHDAHMRFALRIGADAICEKPLVLNPWNIDALQELEKEYGKKIYTVLQLRLHPKLVELKKKLADDTKRRHQVSLTYITSRGSWYLSSWKGSLEKSGGLATNIGIHFFDLLLWLFGPAIRNDVHVNDEKRVSGFLELKNADVQWYLSIESEDLPKEAGDKKTFRSMTLDGNEIEFSDGFTDLHTLVYKDILEGGGFGTADARDSIQLAHDIRHATPKASAELIHPLASHFAK